MRRISTRSVEGLAESVGGYVVVQVPAVGVGPGTSSTPGHSDRSNLPTAGRATTTGSSEQASRSDVFDQEHESEVVNGGRLESPAPIETGCSRVFGMDEYQTDSGQVGHFEGFEQEVFE